MDSKSSHHIFFVAYFLKFIKAKAIMLYFSNGKIVPGFYLLLCLGWTKGWMGGWVNGLINGPGWMNNTEWVDGSVNEMVNYQAGMKHK